MPPKQNKKFVSLGGGGAVLEEIGEEEEDDSDNEEDIQQQISDAEKKEAKIRVQLDESIKAAQDMMQKCKLDTSKTLPSELLSQCNTEISNFGEQLDNATKSLEELAAKLHQCRLKRRMRESNIKDVLGKLDAVENEIDLVFIMDATGSMGPYIDGAKQTIRKIVKKIKADGKGKDLRLGFVAYRDIYNGSDRYQVLDFVDDVSVFERFLKGVKSIRSDDRAEDIAVGIQKANELSWMHPTRVAFIVGDDACHGTEFHNHGESGDNYPTGTPGINIVSELSKLRTNPRGGTMNVFFGRITSKTDKMIERFASVYNIDLEVVDFSSPEMVEKVVVKSVRHSVFNSVSLIDSQSKLVEYEANRGKMKKAKMKPYTISKDFPTYFGWKATVPVNVYCNTRSISVQSLRTPLSVNKLAQTYISRFCCMKRVNLKFRLQLARSPFAEGSCRIAFHARLARHNSELRLKKNAMVLKTNKHHGPRINDRQQYFQQMEVSSIACFLANEYNKSAFRPSHCAMIKVLQACVVEEVSDRNEAAGNRFYCGEDVLPTTGTPFTKYCSNTGAWHPDHIDESLLRFVEFSYVFSKEYLIVADLQGVKANGKYYLTDPAILCTDMRRFGCTNMCTPGIVRHLASVQDKLKMFKTKE